MNFPIIQQHDDLIQAVDAKELYQKLGLDPTNWSGWSKNNIANNPYALEGTDYGVYGLETNTRGGRPTTNYALSIDLAKKLAMQVRTDKGEQIRNYFLDCERRSQQSALPDFTNPAEAARAFADQYEAKQIAQAKVAELQPKADALVRISCADGELGIREAAKAVQIPQNDFVEWCLGESKPISSRFLYRDQKGILNVYAHRIKQGLATQKMNSFIGNDGRDRVSPKVRFTPAGITRISELIQSEFAGK